MGCAWWNRRVWSCLCWSQLPRWGWDDRAEALGHYTIPLKRDMKPTGVGRNLQICGDLGLCSRAVNMIYSKPFPDGTIKTRGSSFGSVSRSRQGAGQGAEEAAGPECGEGCTCSGDTLLGTATFGTLGLDRV